MSGDEDNSKVLSQKGNPATIVLINAFNTAVHNTAQTAHQVTCNMMREYLRASSDQFIGVCLYGINTDSSVLETKSVIDIIPLSTPSLENFKTLKKFNLNDVTPSKELILSDVLWHCQSLFANLKMEVSSRNIIILSRLDVPPSENDIDRTLKRVQKLVDININIKLLNISEDEYEAHKFYRHFLVEATRQESVSLPKPIWDTKEIELLIVQHSNRHKPDSQIKFEIGNNIAIAVGVYNLLKGFKSSALKKYKVDKDTNAIVKSFNQMVKLPIQKEEGSDMDEEGSDMDEEETEMTVLKSELLHSKVFADKKISFTDDEMKMIKNPFGPPTMKLLGFKPMNFLCKEKWYFRSGYFLYPNEKRIEGSTVTFKALYKACLNKKVVAICMLCKKVNYTPQLIALLPSSQPFGLNIDVGFDVIAIPFKENVKDVPKPDETSDVTSDEEHKTFMKNLITKLEFHYEPEIFQNPVLQYQYYALETKKIGDFIEPVKDTTNPNLDNFKMLLSDTFYEYFGPFKPITTKRPSSSVALNSKRSKMIVYDESHVQEMIRQKKVDTFTKDELIEILSHHNVQKFAKSLNKKALLELVYKNCSKP